MPGTYCGTAGNAALTVSSAALVTFSPGTYVLNGGGVANAGAPASVGLNLTGSALVSGQGVTFYLYNGASFNIAGFGITLKAPVASSPTFPGILIYQDRSEIGRAHV